MPSRRMNATGRRQRYRPWLEELEDRTAPTVSSFAEQEPNDDLAAANALALPGAIQGAIGRAGDVDYFVVTLAAPGRVTARVMAERSSILPRLRLVDAEYREVVRSDASTVAPAEIDQHMASGTYTVEVSGVGRGVYSLAVTEAPAVTPLNPVFPTHSPAAVADVNADGRPDIVTSLFDTVTIMLGNGDGSFTSKFSYEVGSFFSSIAALLVVDVNADGRQDIITGNSGFDGSVSVLIGNGNGSFQPEQLYAAGSFLTFVESVTVADINNDSQLDIITGNSGFAEGLSVFLGLGNGAFRLEHTLGPDRSVSSVTTADLNDDGNSDIIATTGFFGGVSIQLGNGDGTFQPENVIATSTRAFSLGDVNNDGRADIVTTDSVILGNGDGTFQAPHAIAEGFDSPPEVVADVNGDGKPDVIGGGLVLLGNGDGSFQAARAIEGGPISTEAVTDLNGDGKPDVIGGGLVLLGNGDGSFQGPRAFATGASPKSLAVADVNSDGNPDIITRNKTDMSVLLGDGDGSFQLPRVIPAEPLNYSDPLVVVADVNSDGNPDIVITSDSGGVSVLLGNGDGSYQPGLRFAEDEYASALAVADVNADGNLDIVTGRFILLGNGDGSFQPQISFTAGDVPTGVAVADMNADGNPDIIIANFRGGNVSLLLGNGDGFFQPQRLFAATDNPFHVAVADMNSDGKPDIVTNDAYGTGVSVLSGNGDGSFQPMKLFAQGQSGGGLAITRALKVLVGSP